MSRDRKWLIVGMHVVGKGSWKKREVRKFKMKLERIKLKSSKPKLEKFLLLNTALKTFQLRSVLSNLLVKWKLSNFRFSNLRFFNFAFFPTAISNYMYPVFQNSSKSPPGKLKFWKIFGWDFQEHHARVKRSLSMADRLGYTTTVTYVTWIKSEMFLDLLISNLY